MKAALLESRRIWNEAPHNAFTDLIRHNERWYCVFREGSAHVSPDGELCVISSSDGARWELHSRISSKSGDLRDAKITITPRNELMLLGCEATGSGPATHHQSYAWFSRDGRSWSERVAVGQPDYWLWRATWHRGVAYGIGYSCRPPRKNLRLYSSRDGREYTTLVENLLDANYPNETSIIFQPDGTALCLARREEGSCSAQLGTAQAPYTSWTWRDLGISLGGPHLLRLPGGRIIAGGRVSGPRTALLELDPHKGALDKIIELPSGGDTSYPGLVHHEGVLWVSYYSSHEGKTSIYLARVNLS